MQAKTSDRTLLLYRLLREETDREHPMSIGTILERLGADGSPSARKSIYRDAATLRRNGIDVVFRRGPSGGWYLARHDFTDRESRLMIDAVTVYPWMSEAQRERLLEGLLRLAPRTARRALRRPVARRPEGGVPVETVWAVVDRIQAACRAKRPLRMRPMRHQGAAGLVPAGPRRIVSPKALLWSGGRYLLLAWDHREGRLRLFRTDRMDEVVVLDLPVQGPEVPDPAALLLPFGPAAGRVERVRLRCHVELTEEVLDRFGQDTALLPARGDRVDLTALTAVGPALWDWLTVHRAQVEVLGPLWVAETWRTRCPAPPEEERSLWAH